MKKLIAIASGLTVLASNAAFADTCSKPSCATPVPEIDVTTGVGAAILMLGVAALLWERRSRA